jgi:hypothetical protein
MIEAKFLWHKKNKGSNAPLSGRIENKKIIETVLYCPTAIFSASITAENACP